MIRLIKDFEVIGFTLDKQQTKKIITALKKNKTVDITPLTMTRTTVMPSEVEKAFDGLIYVPGIGFHTEKQHDKGLIDKQLREIKKDIKRRKENG